MKTPNPPAASPASPSPATALKQSADSAQRSICSMGELLLGLDNLIRTQAEAADAETSNFYAVLHAGIQQSLTWVESSKSELDAIEAALDGNDTAPAAANEGAATAAGASTAQPGDDAAPAGPITRDVITQMREHLWRAQTLCRVVGLCKDIGKDAVSYSDHENMMEIANKEMDRVHEVINDLESEVANG